MGPDYCFSAARFFCHFPAEIGPPGNSNKFRPLRAFFDNCFSSQARPVDSADCSHHFS
jgi:hypothetical protein